MTRSTGKSLAERAQEANYGNVERVPEGRTLRQQIADMEPQFAMALPKGIEAAQLVRDALTCLRQTPKLADCTPQSVLGSLMTCAQLGLRPGVLGHAWVLPYWDSKSRTNQAQLIVGYKGFVELAYRSPAVASVIARTVFEGDTFDVEYGLDDKLIHRPAMTGEDRKPVAHYAIVKLTNGGRAFWVLGEQEVQAWKERYAPRDRNKRIVGPWVSDYLAMARKTALLRLATWMPKSTELAYAIEVDTGVRTNVDPTARLGDVTHKVEQMVPEDTHPSADEPVGDVPPDEDQCPVCGAGSAQEHDPDMHAAAEAETAQDEQ